MRVIKGEVFHGLNGLSLSYFCIALVLELRLAFTVGISGIIENVEDLFALQKLESTQRMQKEADGSLY